MRRWSGTTWMLAAVVAALLTLIGWSSLNVWIWDNAHSSYRLTELDR